MLHPVVFIYDQPTGTVSLYLAVDSAHMAVGRSTTSARQSGTPRYQMNLEIPTVLITLNGSWKQFSLVATSVPSALEVILWWDALYISTFYFTYLLHQETWDPLPYTTQLCSDNSIRKMLPALPFSYLRRGARHPHGIMLCYWQAVKYFTGFHRITGWKLYLLYFSSSSCSCHGDAEAHCVSCMHDLQYCLSAARRVASTISQPRRLQSSCNIVQPAFSMCLESFSYATVSIQSDVSPTRIEGWVSDVIVRPLSTVGYTSVVASVIHSRQWSN